MAQGFQSDRDVEPRQPGWLQSKWPLPEKAGLGKVGGRHSIDWVVYCVGIGNADAHAKNLALTCVPDGRRSMAPFCGLVPTIALPERLVDRAPALSIGAAKRIDSVATDDWRAFVKQAGLGARFTLDRVVSLARTVREKLPEVADRLVAEGADPRTVMERTVPAVGAQVRRLVENVSRPRVQSQLRRG